jgi:8-oxo-dGTP pyrophosphatase MutT (NUDIX family)
MPKNIDIFDKNNQSTDHQSTIDNALRRGLWHRGVHIVVYTKTGYVLIQKRSNKLLMHPGYLDISCGGFVDAGENPERAAVRELKEELGIQVKENELRFTTLLRKNHAWRRLRRHDRAFIYCYVLRLPDHRLDLSHLQESEVSWAGFVKLAQAHRLLRLHYLKVLGRIEPLYGFYKKLLRAIELPN